ncbi:outer membrane lipoprotein-sorting protein [Myxococcota bacterium]|nr:outer membrane lipoprotein-sorting protein [Myxococcota bacterium]MBU1382948.1 outer membrane lipoprotein-sorting protein [Myxococcota bacterium]MBU1495474.1 outer membrane lipoprotein-sorting protein [Myxococcota bacterium]
MYRFSLLFVLFLFVSQNAHAANWGKCSADTKTIVDQADRIMFSKSSAGKMTMVVKKTGYSSSMTMKFWSEGRDKMLVKITAPARNKNTSTLKVVNNVWYYMPRTDRIVKVNSSMMGESWMGSHFTNDDLVRETQLYKHYTCDSRTDTAGEVIVTLKPKPDAPVVWGKIIMKIRKKDNIPIESGYYSEKGVLKRTMQFSNIKTVDGRTVPTVMTLKPAGSAEYTQLTYEKIRFDVAIPSSYFSLRGLKK